MADTKVTFYAGGAKNGKLSEASGAVLRAVDGSSTLGKIYLSPDVSVSQVIAHKRNDVDDFNTIQLDTNSADHSVTINVKSGPDAPHGKALWKKIPTFEFRLTAVATNDATDICSIPVTVNIEGSGAPLTLTLDISGTEGSYKRGKIPVPATPLGFFLPDNSYRPYLYLRDDTSTRCPVKYTISGEDASYFLTYNINSDVSSINRTTTLSGERGLIARTNGGAAQIFNRIAEVSNNTGAILQLRGWTSRIIKPQYKISVIAIPEHNFWYNPGGSDTSAVDGSWGWAAVDICYIFTVSGPTVHTNALKQTANANTQVLSYAGAGGAATALGVSAGDDRLGFPSPFFLPYATVDAARFPRNESSTPITSIRLFAHDGSYAANGSGLGFYQLSGDTEFTPSFRIHNDNNALTNIFLSGSGMIDICNLFDVSYFNISGSTVNDSASNAATTAGQGFTTDSSLVLSLGKGVNDASGFLAEAEGRSRVYTIKLTPVNGTNGGQAELTVTISVEKDVTSPDVAHNVTPNVAYGSMTSPASISINSSRYTTDNSYVAALATKNDPVLWDISVNMGIPMASVDTSTGYYGAGGNFAQNDTSVGFVVTGLNKGDTVVSGGLLYSTFANLYLGTSSDTNFSSANGAQSDFRLYSNQKWIRNVSVKATDLCGNVTFTRPITVNVVDDMKPTIEISSIAINLAEYGVVDGKARLQDTSYDTFNGAAEIAMHAIVGNVFVNKSYATDISAVNANYALLTSSDQLAKNDFNLINCTIVGDLSRQVVYKNASFPETRGLLSAGGSMGGTRYDFTIKPTAVGYVGIGISADKFKDDNSINNVASPLYTYYHEDSTKTMVFTNNDISCLSLGNKYNPNFDTDISAASLNASGGHLDGHPSTGTGIVSFEKTVTIYRTKTGSSVNTGLQVINGTEDGDEFFVNYTLKDLSTGSYRTLGRPIVVVDNSDSFGNTQRVRPVFDVALGKTVYTMNANGQIDISLDRLTDVSLMGHTTLRNRLILGNSNLVTTDPSRLPYGDGSNLRTLQNFDLSLAFFRLGGLTSAANDFAHISSGTRVRRQLHQSTSSADPTYTSVSGPQVNFLVPSGDFIKNSGTYEIGFRLTDFAFGHIDVCKTIIVNSGIDLSLSELSGAFTANRLTLVPDASTIATDASLDTFPIVNITMAPSSFANVFYMAPETPGLINLSNGAETLLATKAAWGGEDISFLTVSGSFNGYLKDISIATTIDTSLRDHTSNSVGSSYAQGTIAQLSTKRFSLDLLQRTSLEDIFVNRQQVMDEINHYLSVSYDNGQSATVMANTSLFGGQIRKAINEGNARNNDDFTRDNVVRQLLFQLYDQIKGTNQEYRLTSGASKHNTALTGMFHSSKGLAVTDASLDRTLKTLTDASREAYSFVASGASSDKVYYPFEFLAGDTLSFKTTIKHDNSGYSASAFIPGSQAPSDLPYTIKILFQ